MKSVGLKIASLLCAVSLWFFVVSGKNYSLELDLPLTISGFSPILAISSHVPRTISAVVEGSGLDLIRLKQQDSLAWMELDFSHILLGTQTIVLGHENFHTALRGITLVSIKGTHSLDVEIDTRISQEVPVRLHTELKPAKGFVLVGDPVLLPASIQISGSRKVLTRIFEIPTSNSLIPNLTHPDTLELPLNLEGYANQVQLKERFIRVAVNVQKRITRKFNNLPVQLVGPSQLEHPKIQPDHVSLEVVGGEDVLRELPAQEIRIFLESTRFAVEGTDTLQPTVFIDRPIESWTLTPSTIHLVKTIP